MPPAGLVGKKHGEQDSEGKADCLERDAGVGLFEDGGDAAEDQSFEQGVDRGGKWRPSFLENCDKRGDESADEAAHHPRDRGLRFGRVGQTPCPRRRGDNAEEQDTGFIDGALDGHRFAGGDLALEGFFV
jgi:hypothetical protein